MEETLTSQQIDDLREFFSAAMDVANYGMNQTMMDPNSKVNAVRCHVTGERFKAAATKAAPHLGFSVQWKKPKAKKTKAAKGTRADLGGVNI